MRGAWTRTWVGGVAGMLLACAPAAEFVDTDAGTDTEGSSGSSGDTGVTLDAADDNPDDTPDDNVDDADDVDDIGTTTADDVSDADSPMTDSDDNSDDGCPPGTEDCPCDIGAQCDAELSCDVDSGLCVGIPACVEPEGEPNEDESIAIDLGELACNSMAESTFGALSGTDLDMFQVHIVDSFMCFSDPSMTVTAEVDIRACMFFECDEGTASVGCPGGQEASDSPAGHPGCCGLNEAGLSNRNCNGSFSPESGTVYMRVGQSETEACLAYNIDYEF